MRRRPVPRRERGDLAAVELSPAIRYRRSQVLGLLLVAAIILAVALLRADTRILFPPGWWRL